MSTSFTPIPAISDTAVCHARFPDVLDPITSTGKLLSDTDMATEPVATRISDRSSAECIPQKNARVARYVAFQQRLAMRDPHG
jgi:hypothetical protein